MNTVSNAGSDPVDQQVEPLGQDPLVEADCEETGFSSVSDGCTNWPCYRTPLERWEHGWRCPKCGGGY